MLRAHCARAATPLELPGDAAGPERAHEAFDSRCDEAGRPKEGEGGRGGVVYMPLWDAAPPDGVCVGALKLWFHDSAGARAALDGAVVGEADALAAACRSLGSRALAEALKFAPPNRGGRPLLVQAGPSP